MSVSVALAAYNGMPYIREQVYSILLQLNKEDELVISLNPGEDGTEQYVKALAHTDERVKVFTCMEKGIIANFENAICHCHNDIVFLSDQDDVWVSDKVEKVLSCFRENTVLVEHDCLYTDENLHETGETLFQQRHPHAGFLYNYVHNTYQGSCMAFRRELVQYICPVPRDIAMHDQWIGMLAEKAGDVVFLPEPLLLYRRHENTGTGGHISPVKKFDYMRRLLKPYHEQVRRIHERQQ